MLSDIMYDSDITNEYYVTEDRIKRRYSIISKIFILIAVIFTIFIVIVFLGINSLGYGYDWALIDIDGWIITLCTVLGFFIILELLFFFHHSFAGDKVIVKEKPVEFIDGKKVYVFTYPEGKEGGIFSKTYVDIDKNTVLRVRALMIPPEDLWEKEE
jgi:hypothetical protein